MPAALARRDFFRRMRGRATPLRPPGSLDEAALDRACDRCGDCIGACPQAILIPGDGGLPEIDLTRGPCTFCGACAEACAPGAILPATGWTFRAVISDACLEPRGITCRVCETACDEAAFRFRPQVGGRTAVIVDPERCTGCGGCVATCPAGAIRIAEPTEEETRCPTA